MANTHSTNLVASSDQFWYVADTTPLSLNSNHTYECWFKIVTDMAANEQAYQLITKDDPNSGWNYRSYGFSVKKVAGGYQIGTFIAAGGGSYNVWWANLNYTVGTWTHVAASCTLANGISTKFTFYQDGSSIGNGTDGTGTNTTNIYDSTAPFRIGAFNNGAPYYSFDGKIDEARVWNTARTGSEISSNYNKELVGNESGLVGYWKLNNDANDSTSNAANLTGNGSPTFVTDRPFDNTTATHNFSLLGVGS
jgi:Concanavalin A-like lectin/glucanases superfamily